MNNNSGINVRKMSRINLYDRYAGMLSDRRMTWNAISELIQERDHFLAQIVPRLSQEGTISQLTKVRASIKDIMTRHRWYTLHNREILLVSCLYFVLRMYN
jgi:hypothetical protein